MKYPSILVKYYGVAPGRLRAAMARDYNRPRCAGQSGLKRRFRLAAVLCGGLLAGPVLADCDNALHPYSVQGTAAESPLQGETVTVTGTVTQVTPDIRGFFIQGPGDGDPLSSEALFIFAPGHTVERSRRVAVTGEVKEFHGLTELTRVSAVTDCGAGELPDPIGLGPGSDRIVGEPLENMRVRLPATRIIDNHRLLDVGELVVAAGDRHWTLEDASNARRLESIPWGLPQDPRRVANGSRVEPLTGVLTWRWNRWVVLPDDTPEILTEDWSRPEPEAGQVRLVTFNIENLFNGLDGDFSHSRGARSTTEWHQQRRKVATALLALDADLLLLQEVEHDQGSDSEVLAELVAKIEQLGGRSYTAIAPTVRPGDDAITNAFLYDAGVLTSEGHLQRIDTEPRPALVTTFQRRDSDETVQIINVHMKSRGRSCDNLCKADRAEELAQIMAWLEDREEQSFRLLGGDFNTLTDESLWAHLIETGWRRLEVAGPTYWFRGQPQQIDHFWLHNEPDGLAGWVQPGHAEMPPMPWLHPLHDPDSPWGASDHNPVILHW